MRQLVCSLALSILSMVSACGETGSSVPAPKGSAQASLKSGMTLVTHGECGVNLPACPANTDCLVVYLDTGTVGPSCVAGNVCDLLSCGTGSCTILESYPGQALCSK